MSVLAAVLSHVLVAYIVLVCPWLGRRRYRALQTKLAEGTPGARIGVYRRMLSHQTAMVLVVVIILWVGSISRESVGLVVPAPLGTQVRLVLVLVAGIGISGLFFRWKADRFVKRMLEMAVAILPTTAIERWWFAALSIGAGISEELLFRGFLLYYLGRFLPGLNWWPAILIGSAVFGFAHLFQGWRGILATGVLGAVFGLIYALTDSLFAPAVIHAAIDLRMLIVATPQRMRALGVFKGVPDSIHMAG
jgi:membrane protease YdiL (CAAX protease family)